MVRSEKSSQRERPSAATVVKAATDGDVASVKWALKSGFDPNASAGPLAMTALHACARQGHLRLAATLLDAGADPHREDNQRRVPLTLATSAEMVRELCRHGADPNHVSSDGLPVLAFMFETAAVKALLSCGADVNVSWDWTFDAVGTRYGSLTKLVQLAAFSLLIIGRQAHTCKNVATAVSIIRLLLEAGADPNLVCMTHSLTNDKSTGECVTALDYATRYNWEVTERLLKAGADPNAMRGGKKVFARRMLAFYPKSKQQLEARGLYDPRIESLAKAVVDGDIARLRKLASQGVDLNQLTVAKLKAFAPMQLPLCLAVRLGRADLVAELLKLGADPNMCDGSGVAPLHQAVEQGDADLAETLLASGADPNRLTERARPEHVRSLIGGEAMELRRTLLRHDCELYPLGPPDPTMVYRGSIRTRADARQLKQALAAERSLKKVRHCKVLCPYTGDVLKLAPPGALILSLVSNGKARGSFVQQDSDIDIYGDAAVVPFARALASRLKARFQPETSPHVSQALDLYQKLVSKP